MSWNLHSFGGQIRELSEKGEGRRMERGSLAMPSSIYKGIEVAERKGNGLFDGTRGFLWVRNRNKGIGGFRMDDDNRIA